MRRKAKAKKWMQRRADDLKSLIEQRADLVQEMNDLTNTAETEKRAFTPEEDAKFDKFFNGGEISKIADAVTELSGYGKDKKKKVKNS